MSKVSNLQIEKEIDSEVACGILPAMKEERTLNFLDAFLILSGYCIATWSYTQGAYLTGLVGFKQLLITSFAGAILMLLIYQLPVILSTRFGIDIWIWLRAVFGVRGVKIVSVAIIIVNFPWYAVCCELFASSMTKLLALFGIMLPSWSFLLLKLLCVGIGTFLAWQGVKTINKTTRILVPLLLAVGVIVIIIALRAVPVMEIWNYEPAEGLINQMPVVKAMSKSGAYILALEANFAFVITLVGGMAGVPRLCKSEKGAFYAGVFGQGISGSFFVVVGAVMVISMKLAVGKETTDPTEMLSSLGTPLMALLSLLLVAFANIGTQAVGSYLYGVTLRSSFKKLSYHALILILASYISVLCIWGKIIEYFGSFLTLSAIVYAPLAALLFSDFFIVRKQKIDFRSAYELKGHDKYYYSKGYNIVGLCCLVFGSILSLAIFDPIGGVVHIKFLFVLTPTGASFLGTLILYVLLSKIPSVRRYIRRDISLNPDTTPFDRKRTPPRQSIFLLPLIWLVSFIETKKHHLEIKKNNMEGFKPPYLVLGTHQSIFDFYVTPLCLFPHRANYISELEGFENYGEWIYRKMGCLGTRKFVTDLLLVKNIKKVLIRGDSLVLYPSARYANIGTSSKLPISVAKLIKMLKYPVVVLNMKGDYLTSPIWNLKERKEARLSATVTGALLPNDIDGMSFEEIMSKLSGLLSFDEYEYQKENNIHITYEKRAEGLEKPLYKCMKCGKENSMKSSGSKLFCGSCGAEWEMDELGELIEKHYKQSAENFESELDENESLKHEDKAIDNIVRIKDWYDWERSETNKEISEGKYSLSIDVHIFALPNAKNFIDCGIGNLSEDSRGFTLNFRENGRGENIQKFFSNKDMPSVHTEYDYRGKFGECITLSTPDNTYFLFPAGTNDENANFHSTKIMFAVEEYYHRLHM